eukprot:CAMPEP_0204121548 /NCGR_PEP_ID=MMETSP0361-20130328/8264_1 /ASSEMBLY_ACC=CAM_ASM_000343 /TAXON_ID=268821 /ORGANISM="Scrippsiella Hangoei, Strain SHTV-5" /LENGTH=75 /DNA_ID=CAMNT_0051072857 /DNA_START=161 /DNA_END=385 /DNA_ORIENTATION=+
MMSQHTCIWARATCMHLAIVPTDRFNKNASQDEADMVKYMQATTGRKQKQIQVKSTHASGLVPRACTWRLCRLIA